MAELKKCTNCDYSVISEEGIYCDWVHRWVGRSSETTCVIKENAEVKDAE